MWMKAMHIDMFKGYDIVFFGPVLLVFGSRWSMSVVGALYFLLSFIVARIVMRNGCIMC
jgi:hypothetical protein